MLVHPGGTARGAARLVAQYRLSLDADFCLRFARAIVEAKLRAQRALFAERRDEDLRWRYPLSMTAGIHWTGLPAGVA